MTEVVRITTDDPTLVRVRGYSLLTGTTAPDPSWGQNGDTYWYTSNGNLYKKTAGAWDLIGNTGGTGSFTPYEQAFASPSTSWVVNHGLGYHPLVQPYSAGSQEVEAQITHASVNQFTVTFLSPQTGFVRYQ